MGLGERADAAHDKQTDRWMDAIDIMKLAIDEESVNIYLDHGDDKDPTQLFYWHIDEFEEDGEVAIAMAIAIDLFHTDKYGLIRKTTYR